MVSVVPHPVDSLDGPSSPRHFASTQEAFLALVRPREDQLDWQILWDADIGDVPELRRQVLGILTTEFQETDSGMPA